MKTENNPVKVGYSAPSLRAIDIHVNQVVCASLQTNALYDIDEVEYGDL